MFAEIDEEPLAAASIAQIHSALLANGREVVVKVRRPGVVEQVELDLSLLRSAAQTAEGRSETARLLQLDALVDELGHHLRTELDLVEEAANTELIGRIVGEEPELVVPEVMRPRSWARRSPRPTRSRGRSTRSWIRSSSSRETPST